MQKGHIVEIGPVQAILEAPEHPYAQLLKNSVLFIEDSGHGKVQPPRPQPRPGRLGAVGERDAGGGNAGRKVRVTK